MVTTKRAGADVKFLDIYSLLCTVQVQYSAENTRAGHQRHDSCSRVTDAKTKSDVQRGVANFLNDLLSGNATKICREFPTFTVDGLPSWLRICTPNNF